MAVSRADPPRAAVVGAGAWGTALANHLAQQGSFVRLWAREPEVARSIRRRAENALFLQGVRLHAGRLQAGESLEWALRGADPVIWAVPVQHSRAALARARPHLAPEALIVSASKGIELKGLLRMEELFRSILPGFQNDRYCALSGPSFAVEVARGGPTAVVIASSDREPRSRAQRLFQSESFRVYTNPDVIGVELGGAVKNVIAVAAGVASGLGLGANTIAALLTRGLAEVTRLGVAAGARRVTFAGLAGMGDLVLTCTSEQSRNFSVGQEIGRGREASEILRTRRTVAEGVSTALAVRRLAKRLGVEMPVSEEVCQLVEGRTKPMDAVHRLMTREPAEETPDGYPTDRRTSS